MRLEDSNGSYAGPKRTFRAAFNALVAAASTAPFFMVTGAAGKKIRIQRIKVSGPTLTAVQYLNLVLAKFTANHTAGTSSDAVKVALDSADTPASDMLVRGYTAAPTPGAGGTNLIDAQRLLAQATTAAAGGFLDNAEFDFRNCGENKAPALNTQAENLSLSFGTAPASAVTLSVEVEWTED